MIDSDGAFLVQSRDKKMSVYWIEYPQAGDLRDRNDAAGDCVELFNVHRPQRRSESGVEDTLIHRQLALDRRLGVDVVLNDQHDVQDDGDDDVEAERNPEQTGDD